MTAAEILAARRAQLARLDPLKSEHRQRAHELYNQAHQIKGQAQERTEERNVTAGNPFDLFPTPPELAARMVDLAQPHGITLEPSAGTGRIAEAIQRAGIDPLCVELNYNAAELLRRRGYMVTQGDFLEYQGQADVIIMNPPFSNGADVDHVLHAYDLLNPGGRIVAIMAPHAFFAQDKKSVAFREWFTGSTEELPPGTFKASGTNVSAKLVVINK
jgi:hypothetical protein